MPIGSIDILPSGRARFRATVKGRTFRETYDTRAEAERVQLLLTRRARTPDADTLGTFGERYLDHRETGLKRRDTSNDRSRWRVHVASRPIANIPLRELRTRDIESWVDSLHGAVRTRRRALCLVRGALAKAMREHIIPTNPAVGVTVEGSPVDRWTYLDSGEQSRLFTSDAVPYDGRVMVAFAIGTGLRQGEQWALELRDVHVEEGRDDPHVIVRWGSRGKPPKTGKTRRVDVLPWLVPIIRAWIECLPKYLRSPSGRKTYKNEHGLLFPTSRGCYRRDKKPPRAWPAWLATLGIVGATGHPVVWHSLRHTCASMLVSGSWGRRWTLQEVAAQLGHASVQTTERYAHLVTGATARAARETVSRPCHAVSETSRATLDSNQWPSIPENQEQAEKDRMVAGRVTSSVTALAVEYVRQVRDGDPMAIATGLRLAEGVLGEHETAASRTA